MEGAVTLHLKYNSCKQMKSKMSNLIHDLFVRCSDNSEECNPTLIALYVYLCDKCQSLHWAEVFSITAKECMEGIGISSYNTWKRTFETLVRCGYVTVKESACNRYQGYLISLSGVEEKEKNRPMEKEKKKEKNVKAVEVEKPKSEIKEKPVSEPLSLFPDDEPVTIPPKLKKGSVAQKKSYMDNVLLSDDEYQKLVAQYGEEDTKGFIELLSNYKGANGRKYKSDYRAILNWVINAYFERMNKYGKVNRGTTEMPGEAKGSSYKTTI